MAEQFAQQVMTKEARDQEVERQNQRKYYQEARYARHEADEAVYKADEKQHQATKQKFVAAKAEVTSKRAEVDFRVEELYLKQDLQVEMQETSNLQLEEQKTTLTDIKNRIVGMTLTQQVIGEGVKLDVLTSQVGHGKTMAKLQGYNVTERLSASDVAGFLLGKNPGNSGGTSRDANS
jgi:hypothetical protein